MRGEGVDTDYVTSFKLVILDVGASCDDEWLLQVGGSAVDNFNFAFGGKGVHIGRCFIQLVQKVLHDMTFCQI